MGKGGCKALDKGLQITKHKYKYEVLFTQEKGEDTRISLNKLSKTGNWSLQLISQVLRICM